MQRSLTYLYTKLDLVVIWRVMCSLIASNLEHLYNLFFCSGSSSSVLVLVLVPVGTRNTYFYSLDIHVQTCTSTNTMTGPSTMRI